MSRLIHVLGGGPWQVPTVQRCKDLGLHVLVTDPNLDRPAFAWADDHEQVDITDAAATLEVSRRHGIDGIVCDTTDWGVATAAFVAETLGLPGIGTEAAGHVTNKGRMRQRVMAAGLPSPRFVVLDGLAGLAGQVREIGLPMVVKPVDNQSGRGVSVVRDAAGLAVAAQDALAASRTGSVLVEQALQGVEIIVDAFVAEGQCHVLGIATKTPYADNPTICSRIHYGEPTDLPAPAAAIYRACCATVAALGIRQGVVHAEFIVQGGAVVPIDVAARGGGVMIYRLVIPHVSGVDVNRAVIEQCVGDRPDVRPRRPPRCACIEFFRLPPGRLDAWQGVDDARAVPGVAALVLNIDGGHVVGALSDKDRRPGYIVALGNSSAEVLATALAAKARLGALMRGHREPIPVF